MNNNVVIFDKPYPSEKIAEGRAVQWAFNSGACNNCNYVQQCETDNKFKFPKNSACMIKKAEILKGGAE